MYHSGKYFSYSYFHFRGVSPSFQLLQLLNCFLSPLSQFIRISVVAAPRKISDQFSCCREMYRGQNHARRHDTQTGTNTNPILENSLRTESTHLGRNKPIFQGFWEMCLKTARVKVHHERLWDEISHNICLSPAVCDERGSILDGAINESSRSLHKI